MKTREIPLEPGAFGWAVDINPYPLRKFPDRTLIKVLRNQVGETTMTVVDQHGKTAELLRCNVLPRLQYHYSPDDKWYPEKSDRAQTILHDEIYKKTRELDLLKQSIENLYWRIRRSGNEDSIERLEQSLADIDPIQPYIRETYSKFYS